MCLLHFLYRFRIKVIFLRLRQSTSAFCSPVILIKYHRARFAFLCLSLFPATEICSRPAPSIIKPYFYLNLPHDPHLSPYVSMTLTQCIDMDCNTSAKTTPGKRQKHKNVSFFSKFRCPISYIAIFEFCTILVVMETQLAPFFGL